MKQDLSFFINIDASERRQPADGGGESIEFLKQNSKRIELR